jgi:mRNA-degrading endonuclease YafQ of YafQ-DinJ toxin-antitoxin module
VSEFSVITSEKFLRQASRFFRKHPDLKPRFATTVSALQHDPFQPSLGLHQLTGKLSGCHAVRLTYSYRITLTLLISEHEIILLDIGSHDEVYR